MGRGDRGWRGVGAAVAALVLAACNPTPVPTATAVPLPSPTSASSPLPEPTASTAAAGAEWQPLHAASLQQTSLAAEDFDSGLLSAEILDAVSYNDGLVAVGGDALGARTWFTPDGVTWTRGPDNPLLDGVLLTDVATDGQRLVAMGYHEGIESSGTGVWESRDGLTWKSVPTNAFANEDESLTVVNGLTYGPAGFVAVGGGGGGGCDDTGELCWDYDPFAWASRDGSEWTKSRYDVDDLGIDLHSFGELRDVTATESGYLAVGGAIWSSPNGVDWTRLDATSSGARLDHVIRLDEGFVAMGANPEVGELLLMTSEDGQGWFQASLDESFNALPETAISSSNGIVVMGTATVYPDDEDAGILQHPAFWSTTDGETWTIQQGDNQDPGAVHASGRVASREVALGSLGLGEESGGPAGVWLHAPLPDGEPPAATPPVRGAWSPVTGIDVADAAPTDVFTETARALLVDDRALIVYQQTSLTGSYQGTGTAWFDPATGRTELGPATDAGHLAPVLSRAGGRVLVIGGNPANGSTRVDTFDPDASRWGKQRKLVNESRQDTEGVNIPVGAALRDGRILLMYAEGYRTVDPATLRVSKLRRQPFEQPFAVLPTSSGSVLALTKRTWVMDGNSNRWTAGPPLPGVGGTASAVSMPDGRIVVLRSGPDGTGLTIEILAADGSGWSVFSAPTGGLPAGSLVALDDQTILSVAAQETCFQPDSVCEVPHLRVATLDLGDEP